MPQPIPEACQDPATAPDPAGASQPDDRLAVDIAQNPGDAGARIDETVDEIFGQGGVLTQQDVQQLEQALQTRLGLSNAEVQQISNRIEQAVEDARQGARDALQSAQQQTLAVAEGASRCKAPDVRSGIEATKWELFAAVAGIGDERKSAADDLVARLAEALRHDEFALALKPRLAVLEGKAIALLAPGKRQGPTRGWRRGHRQRR